MSEQTYLISLLLSMKDFPIDVVYKENCSIITLKSEDEVPVYTLTDLFLMLKNRKEMALIIQNMQNKVK